MKTRLCNVKRLMCKALCLTLFFFALHITHYTLHKVYSQDNPSAGDLITKAWQVKGDKDAQKVFLYTRKVIELLAAQAQQEQASLAGLPKNRPDIEKVSALNYVGTAYFIEGETYRDILNQKEEAIKAFQTVVEKYCFAQDWDQRGWFWSVSWAARVSILKLNPEAALPDPCPGTVPSDKEGPAAVATKVNLYDPGKEDFINYAKYGRFENIGTKDYRYVITDQEGLIAAVGEGIYPNTTSVRWDPEFKKALADKRMQGSHWDAVQSADLSAAFLKWALSSEPQGVKLFYTGLILEKSGLLKHALKCYYAIAVHFPGSYGWTYWHTPWYVGQAAISKIKFILRENPELGYRLSGANIKIINGYDNDVSNDVVAANPGKWEKINLLERIRPKIIPRALKVKKRLGKGKVHLVQYINGDWQLVVENKPYIIKGVTYAPTKVGESPDTGTLGNWMKQDFNGNGKQDGPYDAFQDANKNNLQDDSERAIGDFKLMQDMGVNTIRLYHHPLEINKELLRDLYYTYGIRVIIGDFLGKYAIGSGATWNPGTDYNNETHKKNMMDSVLKMVREFKDEPYVLFWLLGNENVYGYACNADKEPQAFFSFVNEVAAKIKEVDPEHPVAISSGDILYLDKFAKFAPQVDIFGTNVYRGDYGFGFIWRQVKDLAQRPVFITEFGCPAHTEGKPRELAEELQSQYHRAAWEDIESHMCFAGNEGNALGGVVFEWVDEWWKAYEPSLHDTKGLFTGPFPDGFMHEEWLGICSQGDGGKSPYLRQLRKVYFMYKKAWK